jgi:phenylacetate-CoA ligase
MRQSEAEFYDAATETMPAEEREKYLNQALIDIINYAYQNARAVKEKMDRAGVRPSQIRSIKDLERIPITKKDDFAALQKSNPPFGGFLAAPIESVDWIFISPGPIYNPLYQEATKDAKALYAAGFRKGDIVINALSHHMAQAGYPNDRAAIELGATVIPTGTGNAELQVQIMHDLKVTGYIGTGNFLMTLIKKAEEKGYNFCRDFTVRKAFLTAEKLLPSIRRSLEQDYGISVADTYGTSEFGMVAYECNQKLGMHIPEELLVEIVDPQTGKQLEPGEVGEVVVTPFNKISPLIRFGTGDLSSMTTEPCPCGRTSNRLTGILGRVGTEVKVRGMFLHPRQVEEVMAKFDPISNFQVVVGRKGERDEMTINIELKDETIDRQKFADSLAKTFQDICRVRADSIQFMTKGTILEEHKTVVDERTWE